MGMKNANYKPLAVGVLRHVENFFQENLIFLSQNPLSAPVSKFMEAGKGGDE